MSLTTPHAQFFKRILTDEEAARDFLTYYLPPDVFETLDVRQPELMRDSFVDEGLREHFADLLYRVRRKDGSPAWVYILFEHKSRPDAMTGFQLIRYIVRIWEHLQQHGEPLSPILPTVVYHGTRTWNLGDRFLDVLGLPPTTPWRSTNRTFGFTCVTCLGTAMPICGAGCCCASVSWH